MSGDAVRVGEDVPAKVAALFARMSDRQLIESLQVLDARPWADLDDHERRSSAWLADELERRHPAVTPALLAWGEDFTSGRSYAAALLAALAELGVTR